MYTKRNTLILMNGGGARSLKKGANTSRRVVCNNNLNKTCVVIYVHARCSPVHTYVHSPLFYTEVSRQDYQRRQHHAQLPEWWWELSHRLANILLYHASMNPKASNLRHTTTRVGKGPILGPWGQSGCYQFTWSPIRPLLRQ